MLTLAGPLAFGGVDRVVQIGLVTLLALGLFLRPPEVMTLSRRASLLLLVLVGTLVLKEFLPAAFFGTTTWRTILVESYGLNFSWMHHPEPGRAVDALLAGAIGTLWFLWVRTLSGHRENRAVLAWCLFGAAAVVAAVSFLTRDIDPNAIYGLRYTPGWRGFGPFPNRNHTAALLGMGSIIGFGCVAWSGARRRYWLLAGGVVLLGVALAGLMVTQSRGGLIGFATASGLYVLLLLCKLRSKRALAMIATAALAAGALVLDYGGPLFARFGSPESDVSNQTRVKIWNDTVEMWQNAPLFGHGAGTFGSIFPLYQRVQLDNQVVLHPESSWLQWLAELGLLPVLLAVAGIAFFLPGQLRALFARQHNFYLMAAGLAAAGGLLVHSAIDVPAHRWGTAGFALAAAGLAMPLARRKGGAGQPMASGANRASLVPLGIAAFWVLPFLFEWPLWSPQSATRALARGTGSVGVSLVELDQELTHFPLDAQLHELRGFHELLRTHPREEIWVKQFRIAQRLLPASWSLAVSQARAASEESPARSLSYWQQAIERGGMREQELFGQALSETAAVPFAAMAWRTYVRAHPELALAYARTLPEAEGRPWYDFWWEARGSRPEAAIEDQEMRIFYQVAPRWGAQAQFSEWMRNHAQRVATDYRQWAAILHLWKDDDVAWGLLAKRAPEPGWPDGESELGRVQLEQRWHRQPENIMNAQVLATSYNRSGEYEAARGVVVAAAKLPNAPAWFLRKGAYMLASEGLLAEAVELLLRDGPPS